MITTAAAVRGIRDRTENDPRRGFTSPRDFLLAVMDNGGQRARESLTDSRLVPLAVFDKEDKGGGGELAYMLPTGFSPRAAAGSDEQGKYSDTFGGFAAHPAAVSPGALAAVEFDPTAGRTRAIPMSVPVLEIPARTDKDHTDSLTGGFTATRHPETVEFPASRGASELVSLRASSLVGLAYATEEILTDSVGTFAALVASGFRDEMAGTLLREKIRGKGGNEYLGVMYSPAKIAVAKEEAQAADTITGPNVAKMRARCWGFGSAIWLANHDAYLQLLQAHIATAAGPKFLYVQSDDETRPDMLAGAPIYYTEHASTLGDEGDLILCRWSEFLEGTYQPFSSAESIHVRYLHHERTLKFWLRNAGAPWWRAPLTPANSTVTLSPIVTLAARA